MTQLMRQIDLSVVVDVYDGPLLTLVSGTSRKSYQLKIGYHESLRIWVTWAEWGRIGVKPRCTMYLAHGNAYIVIEEAARRHRTKHGRYKGRAFPPEWVVLDGLNKSEFSVLHAGPSVITHHTQYRSPDDVPL